MMATALKMAIGEDDRDIVARARDILSVPDDALDFSTAKLALDALVDPTIDCGWAAAALDKITGQAAAMAGEGADEATRLAVIRRVLFDSGPWNDFRPHEYDHDPADGSPIPGQLLGHLLRTGLGNCAAMPILMLVVAEKLSVPLSLACAPRHLFLRYQSSAGRWVNIEATSGGHPARDVYYRETFALSDRSLESGLYMRALPRREAVAVMASVVLEHLYGRERYQDVIAVADVILPHNPRNEQGLLIAASAYAQLIQREFASVYSSPLLIPPWQRPRYLMLNARNEALFAHVEALGWAPDPEVASISAVAFPQPKRAANHPAPPASEAIERRM